MRDRYGKAGENAFRDDELLELMLFHVHARRDTKGMARELLKRFKTLSGVLNAEPKLLQEIEGIGAGAIQLLHLTRDMAMRMRRDEIGEGDLGVGEVNLGTWSAVLDYCHAAMAYRPVEQFRVLFLDRKNKLIHDQVMQEGTVDQTPVYPREVLKRALELGATAIILVHNHPSGDPTPSQADIDMTRKIVAMAGTMEIVVHDHVIIGRDRHVSMKGERII